MAKSYLAFVPVPVAPNRVTAIWNVTTSEGSPLGEIRWFAPWRRYVFFPVPNTLFDSGCLKEIANFIIARMEERDK